MTQKVSKLKFENGTYELKDTQARNEINNLESEIISLNSQLSQTMETIRERGVTVKDFGAIGDGETDDSEAFNQALQISNNIIIPEGTFKVKNIVQNNFGSVRFIGLNGAKLIPHKRFETTNIPDNMFTFTNGNKVEFINIEIKSDKSQPVTNLTYYTKAMFYFENVGNVVFDGNNIHDIHCDVEPSYYESWLEREGAFLTVRDCNLTFINNKVTRIFGEEWIFNTFKHQSFTDLKALYENNCFGDSTPINGSCVGHLGGKIDFINNELNDFFYGGSAFNLFGDVVTIKGNEVTNSRSTSIFDTTENSTIKNSKVIFKNNIIDSPESYHSLVADSYEVIIENNDITSTHPIHLRQQAATNAVTYRSDENFGLYKKVHVKNNNFEVENTHQNDTNFSRAALNILQTGKGDGQIKTDDIVIENNIFTSKAGTPVSIPINVATMTDNLLISGNTFNYFGKRYQISYSFFIRKVTDPSPYSEKITIDGNKFMNTTEEELTGSTFVFLNSGEGTNPTNPELNFTGNTSFMFNSGGSKLTPHYGNNVDRGIVEGNINFDESN